MISDNNIKIKDIIYLDNNLVDTTFSYKGNYYTTNDFLKVEITNDNDPSLKLQESDYHYIDFNNISDLEYEIVTITKPMIPGCTIRKYDNREIVGIICEKPVEDYNFSTYAYKYKTSNGSFSDIRIGVENEWFSNDIMSVMQLTKLEKIKYLLSHQDDNTLEKIYKVVYG